MKGPISVIVQKVQRLAKRIGRHIGIAFQVYDDILDYTADTETLKKPALEDLSQGVYTLPLLRLSSST